MTIRRILLALSFTGTLAAQTFIQMPDPQFGMYTNSSSRECPVHRPKWQSLRGLL